MTKLATVGNAVAQPDRDNGLQVNWKELSSQPFFGFNPSRAHGPKPKAAVPLDGTPEFDRGHMFLPGNATGASADVAVLQDVLDGCAADSASSWLRVAVARTLADFASAKAEHGGVRTDFRVALPTAEQLDGRCLRNCFQSSHRRRDIVLSQGFQTYGNGAFVTGPDGKMKRLAFHMPFLLNVSLPALVEHYSDVFVALQVCMVKYVAGSAAASLGDDPYSLRSTLRTGPRCPSSTLKTAKAISQGARQATSSR